MDCGDGMGGFLVDDMIKLIGTCYDNLWTVPDTLVWMAPSLVEPHMKSLGFVSFVIKLLHFAACMNNLARFQIYPPNECA